LTGRGRLVLSDKPSPAGQAADHSGTMENVIAYVSE